MPTPRSSERRARLLWALPLAFGVAALAVFLWARQDKGAANALPAEKPAPVATTTVKAPPLEVVERYFAELTAVTSAELTVGEAGRVVSVAVREGDRVEKGKRLLQLDADLARAEASRAKAARAQATAELEQAEREAQRFKALGKEAIVSTTETEQRQTQARVAEASRQGSEAQLSVTRERIQRHAIVAPFDGIIARRAVDPGDWVNPGEVALSLVTDDRVEVFTRVPPALLDRAGVLSEVKAEVIKRNQRIPLETVGVVGALDPQTRTALVRLRPTESATWLRAGDTAEVAFFIQRKEGLVVPRDALVHGVADVRVIQVKDNKAVPIKVEVIAESGPLCLVQGGELSVGDSVVVRGNERLRPGQPLSPSPLPAASGSAAP